jgi:hypothetical protein
MARGMSGGKAGNGSMKGGGSLFPAKQGYSVLSSSSPKVNSQKGNLKIGKGLK